VNLVCGSRAERGKARPGTAVRQGGERETPERLKREGLSTDPGRAGGPACSSGETPA
jgi:hypothetical protein